MRYRLGDVGVLGILFRKRPQLVACGLEVVQIDERQSEVELRQRSLLVLVVRFQEGSKLLDRRFPTLLLVKADRRVVLVQRRIGPHYGRHRQR